MKFKIPVIAIVIIAAICFINKEEIKDMFNGDQPAICEVCRTRVSMSRSKLHL